MYILVNVINAIPGSGYIQIHMYVNAASSATVQIRIILDDGSANQLTRAIEGRAEPVIKFPREKL